MTEHIDYSNSQLAKLAERFIDEMRWSDQATDLEKTLVIANVRSFSTWAAREVAQTEPDWFYCDIDPDEGGDSAYEAMHAHRPRLEPVELRTSFIGPRKWGVMSPALPQAEDDSETAHTFDTLDDAQQFCREQKALLATLNQPGE